MGLSRKRPGKVVEPRPFVQLVPRGRSAVPRRSAGRHPGGLAQTQRQIAPGSPDCLEQRSHAPGQCPRRKLRRDRRVCFPSHSVSLPHPQRALHRGQRCGDGSPFCLYASGCRIDRPCRTAGAGPAQYRVLGNHGGRPATSRRESFNGGARRCQNVVAAGPGSFLALRGFPHHTAVYTKS